MKRRGFLGFMGGAAVAGPGMVKQAAAATLADLNLGAMAVNVGNGIGGGFGAVAGMSPAEPDMMHWVGQMTRLMARSADEHRERERTQYISALDPDLAVNRSLALHMKIRIQRKREYWRSLQNEKSWLQRRIDGIMDW